MNKLNRYNLDLPTNVNPAPKFNTTIEVLEAGSTILDTKGNIVYTVPQGDSVDVQTVGALDIDTGTYANKNTKRYALWYYLQDGDVPGLPAGTYSSPILTKDASGINGIADSADTGNPKQTTKGADGGTPGADPNGGGGMGFITAWNPFHIHLKSDSTDYHDWIKMLFWIILAVIVIKLAVGHKKKK